MLCLHSSIIEQLLHIGNPKNILNILSFSNVHCCGELFSKQEVFMDSLTAVPSVSTLQDFRFKSCSSLFVFCTFNCIDIVQNLYCKLKIDLIICIGILANPWTSIAKFEWKHLTVCNTEIKSSIAIHKSIRTDIYIITHFLNSKRFGLLFKCSSIPLREVWNATEA